MTFLNTLSAPHSSPSADDLSKPIQPPPETIKAPQLSPKSQPTAGKKVAMPSFGRSPAQVEAFAAYERQRVAKLTEEEELQAQKQEQIASELVAILEPTPTSTSTMPEKFWQL